MSATEGTTAVALSGRVRAFLQRIVDTRPTRARSPGLSGWGTKIGVGRLDPSDPGYVVYSDEDYAQAAAILQAGVLDPELPQVTGNAHVQRPGQLAIEAALRENVAVKLLQPQNGLSEIGYWAMPAAAALRLPHDALLLCDTLESMQSFHRWSWLGERFAGTDVLAIYKGSSAIFRRRAAQALILQSTAPVFAFVNLSPVGLRAAARLPRLAEVCVPSWPELATYALAAPPDPSFARQRELADADLRQCQHADVRRAWEIVRALGRSVPLECMTAQARLRLGACAGLAPDRGLRQAA